MSFYTIAEAVDPESKAHMIVKKAVSKGGSGGKFKAKYNADGSASIKVMRKHNKLAGTLRPAGVDSTNVAFSTYILLRVMGCDSGYKIKKVSGNGKTWETYSFKGWKKKGQGVTFSVETAPDDKFGIANHTINIK